MITGELLEQRGWKRWNGQQIWLYESARLLWCVKYGFIVKGRKR